MAKPYAFPHEVSAYIYIYIYILMRERERETVQSMITFMLNLVNVFPPNNFMKYCCVETWKRSQFKIPSILSQQP